VYSFGGPTATFVQPWVCSMVFTIAIQLFVLAWKLHKRDRHWAQILMVR
jgi:hypothetical protein